MRTTHNRARCLILELSTITSVRANVLNHPDDETIPRNNSPVYTIMHAILTLNYGSSVNRVKC